MTAKTATKETTEKKEQCNFGGSISTLSAETTFENTCSESTCEEQIENEIRVLAYLLWEQAGKPEGDGVDYWLQAENEISV